MASQEVGNAELGTASASRTPGSHVEPGVVKNSAYQPIDRSQNYQKPELQVLGAIQILNGAIILALGVFLGSLQSLAHLLSGFLFTFYTGYPLWGPPFYIISGSLSVAAGIKPTRKLVETSYGINMSSATIALAGFIVLSVHLAVNKLLIKTCLLPQSPDLCIYMGAISNGLVSIMLILTLLELCITVYLSITWFRANCCRSREAISPPPNSVASGMPPDESKSEFLVKLSPKRIQWKNLYEDLLSLMNQQFEKNLQLITCKPLMFVDCAQHSFLQVYQQVGDAGEVVD